MFLNPRAHFLFDNPDHLSCERSVDGLHRSGKFWQLQEVFPEHDTEGTHVVPTIDFRARVLNVFDRRPSNWSASFQACPQLDTNRFLASFLLCVCLTTFCNKLLVTQVLRPRIARPLCDGRPFASSPFRRLASRGPFFLCGALLLWPLQVTMYLCKRQIPNDHVPHKKETCQSQCNRPSDGATCHLHTAIWEEVNPY